MCVCVLYMIFICVCVCGGGLNHIRHHIFTTILNTVIHSSKHTRDLTHIIHQKTTLTRKQIYTHTYTITQNTHSATKCTIMIATHAIKTYTVPFFFVRAKPYIAVTHTRLITRLFEILTNKRFSMSHAYTQRHAHTLVRLRSIVYTVISPERCALQYYS